MAQLKINLFERYFDDLLKENFLLIAPYILLIYPLLGFVDAQMIEGDPIFFISLRMAFCLPVLISYLGIKSKVFTSNIILHVYSQFIFLGLGVSVASYFLGGLRSDYYFGIIIISFLQFTFLPLRPKHGAILDIFYFIIFFGLNYLSFDYDSKILIKQSSNFISFTVFKFLSSSRSQNLILGSMHKYSLDKELDDNEDAAQLFGELCHLISNPLFISQALVKKAATLTNQSEVEGMLNKSLASHQRISSVVSKMLEFNRSKKGIKSYRSDLNTSKIPNNRE